jgi:hypothetical protein
MRGEECLTRGLRRREQFLNTYEYGFDDTVLAIGKQVSRVLSRMIVAIEL